MKSRVITQQDGTTKRYYRYNLGNDIISTTINKNGFWGSISSAPSDAEFVIDGTTYYYKNSKGEWQKLYLTGGDSNE